MKREESEFKRHILRNSKHLNRRTNYLHQYSNHQPSFENSRSFCVMKIILYLLCRKERGFKASQCFYEDKSLNASLPFSPLQSRWKKWWFPALNFLFSSLNFDALRPASENAHCVACFSNKQSELQIKVQIIKSIVTEERTAEHWIHRGKIMLTWLNREE